MSLEETNSPYTTENFEIEIYEIKEDDGVKREIKLENKEIFELFDIIVDETLPEYSTLVKKRKSIFIK